MTREREIMFQRLAHCFGTVDDVATMNELAERGWISDLCVNPDDIADTDLVRAFNLTH